MCAALAKDSKLENEVLDEGRAHERLVRRAKALSHSISELSNAVKEQEGEMSNGGNVVKTDVINLKADLKAIKKAFHRVHKMEGVPDDKSDSSDDKLTKEEQALYSKHDTLQKQADGLEAQAQKEADSAAKARLAADADVHKYQNLLQDASKEQQVLEEKRTALEAKQKAAQLKKAAEQEAEKEVEAVNKKVAEDEERAKEERKEAREKREAERRAEKARNDKQAKKHHDDAVENDDRPEREADAILLQAEKKKLDRMYKRWAGRGARSKSDMSSIQLFCDSHLHNVSPSDCRASLKQAFGAKRATTLRQTAEEKREMQQDALLNKVSACSYIHLACTSHVSTHA